jgi:hypothetical protein
LAEKAFAALADEAQGRTLLVRMAGLNRHGVTHWYLNLVNLSG